MKKTCFNIKKDTLKINLELRSIIPVIIFHSIIFTLQIDIVHNHKHSLKPVYTICRVISKHIFWISIIVDVVCPPLIYINYLPNKIISQNNLLIY